MVAAPFAYVPGFLVKIHQCIAIRHLLFLVAKHNTWSNLYSLCFQLTKKYIRYEPMVEELAKAFTELPVADISAVVLANNDHDDNELSNTYWRRPR